MADNSLGKITFLEDTVNKQYDTIQTLEKENAKLCQQLEKLTEDYAQLESAYAMSDYLREFALSLSEERRVALSKCSPSLGSNVKCIFCMGVYLKHEPNCDYVRLIKEGE